MKSTLILIRGLPGSGKSTLAKKLSVEKNLLHVEADQFFVNSSGQYVFDQARLSEAHEWCKHKTLEGLIPSLFSKHYNGVIVSNTFTTLKEMEPYLELRHYFDLDISVITLTSDYGSIHDVPTSVLERMKARWEPYTGEKFYSLGEV